MKNPKQAVVRPLHEPLFEKLRHDAEILTLIEKSDVVLGALGFTDHGRRHVTLVAVNASRLLAQLGHDAHACDLAAVSGLLHDIGNVAGRHNHAAIGAALAYPLLTSRDVSARDAAEIVAAIGNHDELELGMPVNAPGAALIVADKADIHRSRVRTRDPNAFDAHDNVNHGVTKAELDVDGQAKVITLTLTTEPTISGAEIAELFESRLVLSDAAARFLGCSFAVRINGETLR